MNKEQLKKALECCKDSEKCDVCPYYGSINCQEILIDDIDFFINRQQTEIERLKAENRRFERNMKSVLEIEKENVRKETAKEILQEWADDNRSMGLANTYVKNIAKKYGVEVEE